MIAPPAVVRDIHAGFAFAGRFDHGTVHVDAGQFEELGRLPSPDALADTVEDVDERGDVGLLETPTEITGRGRIGNAGRTQGVEVNFVLATQLDVLLTGAVADRVVGEVENVIGLVVRQMNFEQVQLFVDGRNQADAARQEVQRADTAMGDAAVAIADLVADVGCGEDRFVEVIELSLVKSKLQAALAV